MQMLFSSYNLSRLRAGLKPAKLHWYSRLGSTNVQAAKLREEGTLYAPSVVLTGHQLAGRGRGTHRWWSPAGCMTVTFVLPADDAVEAHQVPLLAGLAVRRAVAGLAPKANIQLKWPNDLLVGGKKLAGLLCERHRKADLIGVGLNVNVDAASAPEDLRLRLTSLSAILNHPLDMTTVLLAVASSLRQTMRERTQNPFAASLKEYDEHHALVGKRVSVMDAGIGQAVSGKCEGLDEIGRLLVRDRKGVHRIIAGQVVAT